MTWTIIIGGYMACAAWLYYELRTAPLIQDCTTGKDCQCHGLNGIDSYQDGELRRATEGNDGVGFYMDSDWNDCGFAATRIDRVDCVARHRGAAWEVGLCNGTEKWLWCQRSQIAIRKKIAQLATAGHLTWQEAAGTNAFLMRLELDKCNTK